MDIKKEIIDYISGTIENVTKYKFKYEKFYKCFRILLQIKDIENNINQLSWISRKNSVFNNSILKFRL